MEGLDAGDVCLVSLLRRQGVVQLDPHLHRVLRLDDRLRYRINHYCRRFLADVGLTPSMVASYSTKGLVLGLGRI